MALASSLPAGQGDIIVPPKRGLGQPSSINDVPIVRAAVEPAPVNAFAGAKVQAANAQAGANGAITNTTTNPTGATGPAPAKFGFVPGNGVVGANAAASNVFQDRLAPTRPTTPAQLTPGAQGAAAGNRVLLASGGIRAGREAYLRGTQNAGSQEMSRQQAMTNMLLAHMVGLLPDQEEDTTPPPTTVGEAKAYQS